MISHETIPILILVYDRIQKLQALVDSLRLCTLSEHTVLNIFSDAPKCEPDRINIEELRQYCRSISGFREVIVHERESNLGGLENGIQALQYMSKKYPYMIVLEDDCVVHHRFLEVMEKLYRTYFHDHSITSISLYNTPNFAQKDGLYLSKIFNGWGILYWCHKSLLEDLENTRKPYSDMLSRNLRKEVKRYHPKLPFLLKSIDEGVALTDYCATYLNIRDNTYQLRPFGSLVTNTGFDGSGERCQIDVRFSDQKLSPQELIYEPNLAYDKDNDTTFYTYYHPKVGIIKRSVNYTKRVVLYISQKLEKNFTNISHSRAK